MRAGGRRGGFTLAEVAVTIVIVGIAVTMMLQSLNRAKLESAHTRNVKLGRELALLTLGRIESGLHREDDISRGLVGTYADEGYPMFAYEVVVGDDDFRQSSRTERGQFDNWQERRDREEERARKSDDDEQTREPYERVKIKVTWELRIQDLTNELVLERWMPWDQVYGPPDAKDAAAGGQR